MRVRGLRASDVAVLKEMADNSGHPYPENLKAMECVRVVVDDEDRPLMAAAAERIVQIYLWCGTFSRPLAKINAIRMLDESMATALRAKGYREANAFLPPSIAQRFARRLEKTFGWRKNWPSWSKGV